MIYNKHLPINTIQMKYYQQQEHFGVMNNLLTLKLVSINLVELNLKIYYLRSKIFTTNLGKTNHTNILCLIMFYLTLDLDKSS